MQRITLPLFLLLLGLLSACAADDTTSSDRPTGKNAHGYTDISIAQLETMMENKDFTLVNVHIPYEGELPQTDLFIPFNNLEPHLEGLPDKDAPIVVYCRSGRMSDAAARDLAAMGYTNVMEVDGGFNAWASAGNELIQKPQ